MDDSHAYINQYNRVLSDPIALRRFPDQPDALNGSQSLTACARLSVEQSLDILEIVSHADRTRLVSASGLDIDIAVDLGRVEGDTLHWTNRS